MKELFDFLEKYALTMKIFNYENIWQLFFNKKKTKGLRIINIDKKSTQISEVNLIKLIKIELGDWLNEK